MSSNYSKDSFDRFGDDMCQHILSYLEFEERFRYECISKQWHRLVFTTQSELIVDKPDKHVFLDTPQIFESIVTKCTNITRIVGYNCMFRVNQSLLDLIIKHCYHLTDVSIRFREVSIETIEKFMTKFAKQLKTFIYEFSSFAVDFDTIFKWLKMCPNLQSLYYYFLSELSSLVIDGQNEMQFKRLDALQMIIKKHNNDFAVFDSVMNVYRNSLKTIGYVLRCDLDEDIVHRLTGGLSRMKALIHFKLLVKRYFTPDLCQLLSQIGANCPQLKSFDISMNDYVLIMDAVFHTINTSFKRIKRLKICGHLDEDLTSDSLNALKCLTHLDLKLKTIITGMRTEISDIFFANISLNLPHIQSLVATDVSITSVALEELSKLKHIRTGYLSGQIVATKESFKDLIAKYPTNFCFNTLRVTSPQKYESYKQMMDYMNSLMH